MQRKILVDEDTIVHLVAQVALDQYMIELLTTCIMRTFHEDDREQWLADVEQALTGSPIVEAATSEAQAVMLSDAAVQMGQRGRHLVKRLRARMQADREKEPSSTDWAESVPLGGRE